MSSRNGAAETINAAASAIASVEPRSVPSAVAKRRWGGWWRFNRCFGSHKNGKRIGHAIFGTERQPAEFVLPFVAPPSSPVSFLLSQPPSVTQSPARALSFTTSFSPTGPYAHETNLVTPPEFSCFNTEPSTPPFTPPPESVMAAAASPSPKVPFAELLICSLERVRTNSGRYLEFSETKAHLLSPGGALTTTAAKAPPYNYSSPNGDGTTGNRIFSLEYALGIESETVQEPEKEPRNLITFGLR